jgi:hypothetical protein
MDGHVEGGHVKDGLLGQRRTERCRVGQDSKSGLNGQCRVMVESNLIEGNLDESDLHREIAVSNSKVARPIKSWKQATMVVAILGLITSCYTRL